MTLHQLQRLQAWVALIGAILLVLVVLKQGKVAPG